MVLSSIKTDGMCRIRQPSLMSKKQIKISIIFHLCFLVVSLHGFSIPVRNAKYMSMIHRTSVSTKTSDSSLRMSTSGYDNDEEYSRCLTPREERKQIMNEDNFHIIDQSSSWRRKLLRPVGKLKRTVFPSKSQQPGTLILVRCGQSVWNKNYTFTGWADPDIDPEGVLECEHAGRLLLEGGYEPDIIYTSRLKRAIHSVWVIMREINSVYLPVFKSWRLNERHYGKVTGLCKKETAAKLGSNLVQAWRRSLRARPPPVSVGDPYWNGNDRRYSDVPEDQIPRSESLEDCMARTRPLWEYKILKDLRRGNNVMVCAHANTLRGLIKIIDDVDNNDIRDISMPNGIPFVYKFDKDMKTIPPKDGSLTQVHTTGTFLEKPGQLKKAIEVEENLSRNVPGVDNPMEIGKMAKRMTTLEESLLKLREEKETNKLASLNDEWHSNLNVQFVKGPTNGDASSLTEDESDDGDFEEDVTWKKRDSKAETIKVESVVPNVGQFDLSKDPVVVFIRHGRTPHNNLALFTGWEDPNLAVDGVEDAKNAGRLLRRHGFEFDVVYSSWLTRAIETAWYVLDELDMAWLPIVKSWRLNERHYGALTGKSKKMVGNIYGEAQLKKWRRGFAIRPPPASSYSFSYPGNDYRRTKYVKDLRISFSETLNRSIEQRKFQIHRKFPKSESLKDCMARTIPFYTEKIVPEAVAKGKRVLITSHENAIRGILMHLCEIPEEHMNELHLPNGLPLIYNVKRKCISLLDDGSGRDPMEVHDFGSAAQYLFRPCELTDEDFIFDEDESAVSSDAKETVNA